MHSGNMFFNIFKYQNGPWHHVLSFEGIDIIFWGHWYSLEIGFHNIFRCQYSPSPHVPSFDGINALKRWHKCPLEKAFYDIYKMKGKKCPLKRAEMPSQEGSNALSRGQKCPLKRAEIPSQFINSCQNLILTKKRAFP